MRRRVSWPVLCLGAVERASGSSSRRSPASSIRPSKFWLLTASISPAAPPVAVTPFFDLVLTRNTGISYGLFQQQGPLGQWALLAFKAAAVVFLWVWLARAPIAADRRGARPDHRRGGRQCHRPAALAGGHGFRAFSHRDRQLGASTGTSLTSPMWPSLPGLWACCMNRCWRGGAAKAP